MKTFKVLGALLSYPTAELIAALPDLHAVLVEEGLVDRAGRTALRSLMSGMAGQDVIDVEEAYVATFDRGRATSLHLFEHVHGESRDRGQAMVDLQQIYARAGLQLAAHELPDYLPALLEFLSFRPLPEAKEMLRDCAHVLRAIGEALATRGSAHAAVLASLLAIAGERGLDPARPEPQPDEKSMDEEWAEQPAFGPPTRPGCASGVPSPNLRA
jgi:nitrate reductase delta subunit